VLPWDRTPGIPDAHGLAGFSAPPRLRDRGAQGLPPDVDRVIQTLLAIDPAKRYPSAQAAIDDLDHVLARHTSPTQVVGAALPQGPGASLPLAPVAAAVVPAQVVEPHPVEKVLGPDMLKGPMQKARERADALSEQRELVALLNGWSREGLLKGAFRRRLLGRQAVFHRVTHTNVYFYTLKVLYETRTPTQTVEEPDHRAQAPKIEKEQDRWGIALPAPKGFQAEPGATMVLPGSMRVVNCEVCNAQGRVRCPKCEGNARIKVSREPHAPGAAPVRGDGAARRGNGASASASAAPPTIAVAVAQAEPAVVPCPECEGTGSLRCDRCEGAGRMVQRKTTTWRRWPDSFRANDDLPRIDERWLFRACQ
jgi:hypothetical protein